LIPALYRCRRVVQHRQHIVERQQLAVGHRLGNRLLAQAPDRAALPASPRPLAPTTTAQALACEHGDLARGELCSAIVHPNPSRYVPLPMTVSFLGREDIRLTDKLLTELKPGQGSQGKL
jgi:hypothetical protein